VPKESVWLLPIARSWTDYRLPAGMRRYRESGAMTWWSASAPAERPHQEDGPRRVDLVRPDAGPIWDPDTDWSATNTSPDAAASPSHATTAKVV
jgi:hypothetical protein